MASLEKRGEWYRLIFKNGGERFTHSLHTDNEKTALALKGGIERTILKLSNGCFACPKAPTSRNSSSAAGRSPFQ